MKRLLVAISLTLCAALPAAAQTYKWVDANGKVHYSDKPPPGNVRTQTLREPAAAPSPPAADETKSETKSKAKGEARQDAAKAVPETAAEQEQAFRKRQAAVAKAQQEEAQKEAKASAKAENCRRAKAAVANLELGGRQTRIDEKGERVFLTDQQIVQETAKARQEAAAACN